MSNCDQRSGLRSGTLSTDDQPAMAWPTAMAMPLVERISQRLSGAKPAERNNMAETKTHSSDVVDLFIKGMERAAELQKKALEAATEQTSQAIATSRRAMDAIPSAPDMLDTVQQSFERYVEAQKKVIDLVVQQTAAILESTTGSASSALTTIEDFARSTHKAVEHAIEIEKNALGLAAHSAKANGGTTKRKVG
jgi:methyl-accepting chemotaxis protein